MNEAFWYNAVARTLASKFWNYSELKKIKEKYGDWEAAWGALKSREIFRDRSLPDPQKEWERLEDLGVRLVMKDAPEYPDALREIPFPPNGLYVRGDVSALRGRNIAVVGTRRATSEGKNIAREFARVLGEASVHIISGLAFGIDAEAHKGASEAKTKTVAVLANGLDIIRPKTNENLGKQILKEGGALISEYPLETDSFPAHFLERNRIVSGVSEGVVVVEAPERSGSLATARFALEQNRDVYVIPGPARHANYKGSHALVRNGAELVTDPAEVLEAMNILVPGKKKAAPELANEEEQKIFEIVAHATHAVSADEIIEQSGLETHIVTRALTFLMLKNAIKETASGYVV